MQEPPTDDIQQVPKFNRRLPETRRSCRAQHFSRDEIEIKAESSSVLMFSSLQGKGNAITALGVMMHAHVHSARK